MTALDVARAHAEIDIRQFFSTDLREKQDYWYEFEGDGDTVPRFYHKARDYVRSRPPREM
ncbi:MAG TPA: hypothetical protein VEV85_00190 [Bryobacteraceae bacterium]|nr:hypothetical protein [Bryobacteraceae bacterium]